MPDTSPNLALPYLLPAQAQKHVTHNEALARLDLLVQLAVQGFDALTPPATPVVGEIHALGAAPVGDWAGQGGRLAAWDGGAWVFVAPRPGWRAWGLAEGALRIWRGTGWEPLPFDNLAGLGVGTAHDATNRLAVAAPATLLTHAGAGHQLKVNKATAGDTASLLFQDGWSGRAEIGLAGNDDFSLKVSADGAGWSEALLADRSTGRLRLPGGARLPDGSAAVPALAFDTSATTGLYRAAADQIGFAANGVARARLSATALQLDVPLTGTAVTQSATDATAGRVMRVGYSGLGDVALRVTRGAEVADCNALTAIGWYPWGVGSANAPSGYGAILHTSRYAGSESSQLAMNVNINRLRYRTKESSTWTPWRDIYSQDNIIGTVAQSSGVPTGAVIERGSNANGSYLRLADGTQICWHRLTGLNIATALGSGYESSVKPTWTFPAAFVAQPALSGASPTNNRTTVGLYCNNGTAAEVNLHKFTITTTSDQTADVVAIGRWF